MNILNTRALLQKALRRAWIALLIGALFAGGFYFWKTHGAAPVPSGETPAAAEEADALKSSPLMKRYAVYQPSFADYAEHPTLGMNEYAQSIASFAAARFRTDNALMAYYDAVFRAYPDLDFRVFTGEVLRSMVGTWQYNTDVVVSVTAPEIDGDELSSYAAALGLDEKASDAREQAQCLLRDTVFAAVTEYASDPAALADSGVTLTRAGADYEALLDLQSFVTAEADAGILPDSPSEQTRPGKKLLALVFLLGFFLTEAVVIAFALLDDTIRSETDLEQNTDLPVLSGAKDRAALLSEAALKLAVRRAAPSALALAPVGVDAETAAALAAELTAALKATAEKTSVSEIGDGAVAVVGDAANWNDSLTAAIGRSVVLLTGRGKTHCRDLNAAADILRQLEVPVAGALLIDP